MVGMIETPLLITVFILSVNRFRPSSPPSKNGFFSGPDCFVGTGWRNQFTRSWGSRRTHIAILAARAKGTGIRRIARDLGVGVGTVLKVTDKEERV
jgi:hypothetical protein